MQRKTHRDLTRDYLDFHKVEKLQLKYSQELMNLESNYTPIKEEDVNIVVGVDVSYFRKEDTEWGVACAVFWDIYNNKLVETSFAKMKINLPYKPGFLGFREARIIVSAIKKAKIKADLIMCDGHGIIHPRFFGEAVQIGFALNTSSFGVAKKPFIGASNWESLVRIKGNKTPVWLNNPLEFSLNNKLIGYAICLSDKKKPVFISVGFNILIDTALKIALKTTLNNRQPEPLYLADFLAKKRKKI